MRLRSRELLPGLVVPALVLALAACSSIGSSSPPTSSSQSGGNMLSGIFTSSTPATTPATGSNPDDEETCPVIDVRQGASTITVHAAGGEQVATNVRYQATLNDLARECIFAGATLTIKAGVQGRVVVGPQGGEGQLDVPLRLALVQEGPAPKTIWTKLYRIPVAVPPGQTHVPFTHVESDLTVPKPNASALENYVLYAGFDQQAFSERATRRPPPRRQPRPQPR